MALVLNERVKETTTTTGTGALSLGGAPTGFETFAAGIGNSNTTYYAIFHSTADEFEVGLGTLDGDSSDLTRTTVYASSNSDNAVNFSVGTKTVFCTMPAARSVFLDADGDVTLGANLDVGGNLTVTGTTTFNGGTLTLGDANTDNIVFGGEVDSNIIPDDDGTFDLGSASKEWQDLFIDGTAKVDTLTVDENATVAGTLGVTGVLTANAGVVIDNTTIDGGTIAEGSHLTLDVGGDIILDADSGNWRFKDGGTTIGIIVNSSSDLVIKSSVSDKDLLFKGNDGGSEITALTLDMSAAGAATFNSSVTATSLDISGDVDVDGTLEADAITVNGTALASVIAGTTVANATLAATVTVADSTANTNFPVVFHDESNALLDDTGALRYNPSTGELLVPKLTVAGTTTTVDTVTMNAANAVIFEGATADAHETTLTIIDPTGDRTINLPNVSGTLPVLAAASTTQITSTPEELNILDGVTSTAAELNALDGITAVVGELNALDLGSTAVGTAIASKAVILDSNKDYTGFRNITLSGELDAGSLDVSGNVDIDGTLETDALSIASTTVTATAAELNFTDGVTSNIQTQLDTKTTPGFALAMAVAL